jgi:hypothetical protein
MDKFTAPTVEGVQFPAMGLYQAWNDVTTGTLNVGTYAASPDRRGSATTFSITNLPKANNLRITVDGQPFTRFTVTGPTSVRIDTTIEQRQYRIETGYRGTEQRADERPRSDHPQRIAGTGLADTQRAAHDRPEAGRPPVATSC